VVVSFEISNPTKLPIIPFLRHLVRLLFSMIGITSGWIVANPDRTPFSGNFRIGGYSTRKDADGHRVTETSHKDRGLLS
jgi:hypothetical protein